MIDAQDFSSGVFQPTVAAGHPSVYGCDIGHGNRIDVGTIKRFFDTNMRMLTGELADRLAGAELSPGVRVGNETRIDGVTVRPPVLIGDHVTFGRGVEVGPNAIIGNYCTLADGARVENTVLLSNCSVGHHATLKGTILGTASRVEHGQTLGIFTIIGAYSSLNRDDWPYSSEGEFYTRSEWAPSCCLARYANPLDS